MYPPLFIERVSDLFTSVLLSSAVSGLCTSPPSGTLRAQCSGIAEMLVERARTNQAYRFLSWSTRIPGALSSMGWLLDIAEKRALKFVSKHFKGLALSDIIEIDIRATDHAILLKVGGVRELCASEPLSAEKARAALALLSICTLSQRLLPDLFFTDVSNAWLEHGSKDVSGYFDKTLVETPGSSINTEKSRFALWAWNEVAGVRQKVAADLRPDHGACFDCWMFSSITIKTGSATVSAATAEIAHGSEWTVSSTNVDSESVTVNMLGTAPVELEFT